MPIEQNFISYQKSISQELRNAQDRIRDLIGDRHWQTDGEHKESILRAILRSHVPETVRIGRGFVCYPPLPCLHSDEENDTIDNGNWAQRASRQLDVLVTSIRRPTLYKEGELVFVTADAVEAIIEVKTRVTSGNGDGSLLGVLTKLSDQAERIRRFSYNPNRCWTALFVYDCCDLTDDYVFQALAASAMQEKGRVVNAIALGPDEFVRFWPDGRVVRSPQGGSSLA